MQKNKEAHPEVFENKDHKSLSKVSMKSQQKLQKNSGSMSKEPKAGKLKKMLSLEHFDNQIDKKSVHLSEYSRDVSNVKKRREKEARNMEMRDKIQGILTKSKKAIELLKSPNKLNLN